MKLHFFGTGASEGVPAVFCECEYCQKDSYPWRKKHPSAHKRTA